MPAALLVGPLFFENDKWNSMSPEITLKEYRTGTREGFIHSCQKGDFDGVVAIFRSNESTTVTGPFTEEIISVLPPTTKFICHSGAGYDNIDVNACTRRGISVSNTPNMNTHAVADLTIFLMIGALRQIPQTLTAFRKGEWRGQNFELSHDPGNKLLGILGMGGIGREVAKRAKAFGMNIQYHNRHVLPDAKAEGAAYVSFDDLLSTSDVISLHLGLTSSNEHMIGEKEFEKMKKGVVIVNTARGALIDEKALISALDSGKVYSAGLDVFENEPGANPLLLKNEKIIVSPHIAAGTIETMIAMETLVLQNIESAIHEQKLLTQVPEQLQ